MKKFIIGFITILSVYTLYTILILFMFKWINPPTTAFIQQNNDSSFKSILELKKVDQVWIPLNKISDDLIIAVITSEDQLFLDHWGFDVNQIERVIGDFEKGKKLRGASTITQQVAKNLFLFPNKLQVNEA